MAIKALDLSQTRKYVCKDDRGSDEPTVFLLGTLSSRDKGAIRDSVTSFEFGTGKGESEEDLASNTTTRVEKSKMNFEAVRRGLKGWENYLDGKGDAVNFRLVTRDIGGGVKKSVVPYDLLDTLPLSVIDELAEEIMSDNDTEQDEGNGSPAPSSDA